MRRRSTPDRRSATGAGACGDEDIGGTFPAEAVRTGDLYHPARTREQSDSAAGAVPGERGPRSARGDRPAVCLRRPAARGRHRPGPSGLPGAARCAATSAETRIAIAAPKARTAPVPGETDTNRVPGETALLLPLR